MNLTEETKGALPCEKRKLSSVEMQTEGARSWEERKHLLVEGQMGGVDSVWETGCRCRLGPTGMGQSLRQARVAIDGSCEDGGGEPSADIAQAEGPEPKLMEPIHLLGPEGKNLSLVQRGLRVSPVKGHLNEEKKNGPISSDRIPKKQIRGATNWEAGGRRDNHVEVPPMVDDDSRYVESNPKDSPSSLISVFGRPLLLGGSSGQVGSLKLKEIDDLEPLRMVAVDGREWGLEASGALVVIEEGSVGEGQQGEESVSVESEVSGYGKWEDSCLIKFSEFLGFSTVGFESEILGLLSKIVARQHQVENKGAITMSRCEQELKKLVCTINYEGRNQIKGGDKERGSLMIRL